MEKIFTAFVSSRTEGLEKERQEAINVLLDKRILPFAMEHFTISSNGDFSDIEELIDDSDIVILLLGKSYGPCENGISWTEKEYKYAVKKRKPIVAIKCKGLKDNINKEPSDLNEDEKKQIKFMKSIPSARTVTTSLTLEKIINQFLNGYNFAESIGWTRIENTNISEEELKQWRSENQAFNLAGIWYHVHLMKNKKYIRTGKWKIEQKFSPQEFHKFSIEGTNYNVEYYSNRKQVLYEDEMTETTVVGEYTLKRNGEIFGFFNAKRKFADEFGKERINRGIHDFKFDIVAENTAIDCIKGSFYDVAPSKKYGRVFLFRDIEARNQFLIKNRGKLIKRKKIRRKKWIVNK